MTSYEQQQQITNKGNYKLTPKYNCQKKLQCPFFAFCLFLPLGIYIFELCADVCVKCSLVCWYELQLLSSIVYMFQSSECELVCAFVMINVRYPLARWCWTRHIHQHWKDQWAESWQSNLFRANAPSGHTQIHTCPPTLRLCNPLSRVGAECFVSECTFLLVLLHSLSYLSCSALLLGKRIA